MFINDGTEKCVFHWFQFILPSVLTLDSLEDTEIFPLDQLILDAKSENGKLLSLQNNSLSLYVLLRVPAFHYNLLLNNSFVVHC